MAWTRRRFAVLACVLGAAILIAWVGIAATGAFAGKGLKTESATTEIGAQESGSATAECKEPRTAVSGG